MIEPVRENYGAVVREIQSLHRRIYLRKLSDYKLGLGVENTDVRTVKAWKKGSEPTAHKARLLLAWRDDLRARYLERSSTKSSTSLAIPASSPRGQGG